MQIALFSNLAPQRSQRFFDAIRAKGLPPSFADLGALEQYLGGQVFERGNSYLTLWHGEALAGSMGVVVREIETKGEVFLTLIYHFTQELDLVLGRLLQEAYRLMVQAGATGQTVVKIGVSASEPVLGEALERSGFRRAYRILNMVRPLGQEFGQREELRFEPLTAVNQMAFLSVHNAAFLDSPNGGQLEPAELEQMRLAARSPQYLQVGYAGAEAVAILEVDLRGEVGQIQTIGVAPGFQGRGLGKATVAHALQVLAQVGAREAHLQVVEVNEPAVALYRSCGFAVDRVVSTWYYGPAPGTAIPV